MTPTPEVFFDIDPPTILTKLRKGMFGAGVVMIVLGVAALIMPFFGSLVIEVLIGWLLAVSGLVTVVGAFSLRKTGLFVWELAAGLITCVIGLLMLAFPLQGLVALTLIIAVVLVMTGIAQLAFAFWARPAPGWGWGVLSAIVSGALGGFILFALPDASAIILGLFVGVDFVSTGTALVLIARSLRPGV